VNLHLMPQQTAPARRLGVVHTSGYRYDATVGASYNEARMMPPSTSTQSVLDARVAVDTRTWSYTYWDYWGTQVTA
jgi:hypothetical protein